MGDQMWEVLRGNRGGLILVQPGSQNAYLLAEGKLPKCVTHRFKRSPRATQATNGGQRLPACNAGVGGVHNYEGGLTEDELIYWRLSGLVMKVLAKLKDNDNKTLTRVFKGIRAAFGPLPWTNSQIKEILRGRMNSAGEKGKASQHEGYVGPERGGHVGGKGKKLGGRLGAAFVDKKLVVVLRDYRPHFVMYDGGRNVDLEEDVRGPLVADPPPAGDRPLDVEEALEDAQGANLTVIFLGGPKPAFDPAPYIDIGQVAAEVGLDLWDWVAPDEPMAVDPFLELGGVGFPPLEEEDVQFLEGFGQGAGDPVGAKDLCTLIRVYISSVSISYFLFNIWNWIQHTMVLLIISSISISYYLYFILFYDFTIWLLYLLLNNLFYLLFCISKSKSKFKSKFYLFFS